MAEQWEGESEKTQRVLIVDDDADKIYLLKWYLEASGYSDVEFVADAREALAAIGRFRPDLVLLDVQMPHIGGLELLHMLRRSDAMYSEVPIIITSAGGSEAGKSAALSEGATEFFEDFSDLGGLLAMVGRWIGPGLKARS